jgi:hypothetical protein
MISGCSQGVSLDTATAFPEQPEKISPTIIEEEPIETYFPSPSPSPSASLTPSPKVTETSTPDVDINLTNSCVETISHTPLEIDGVLVLKGFFTHDLSLWDFKNGGTINLGESFPNSSISSDFKKFAYVDEKKHQLMIINSKGEIINTQILPEDFGGVIQWVDEDHLLLERFGEGLYNQASSILFNFDTGEQLEEYKPEYPDISHFTKEILWGNHAFSYTAYDHSFTHVLYPAWDGKMSSVVLRNLIEKREILRLYGYYEEMGSSPQWVSDDSHFLAGVFPRFVNWQDSIFENYSDGLPYYGGYDLFSITKSGELKRLTFLTTEYSAAINAISISPDEKKVAFWLNLDFPEDTFQELAVLDIESGDITNLCLDGGDLNIQPVWSYDQNYLAVTVYSIATRSSKVYIIDLNRNFAYQLGENISVEAWMNFP